MGLDGLVESMDGSLEHVDAVSSIPNASSLNNNRFDPSSTSVFNPTSSAIFTVIIGRDSTDGV